MDTNQKHALINSKNLLILLLGIGALYILVTTLVDNRFQEIEAHTRDQVSKQQSLLAVIAETTARNGADAVTESIVRDCAVTERFEFDSLLGRLDQGLSRTELVELERLFGRCASFSSDRKSVMVSRFSREIDIYEDYVKQLNVITGNDNSQVFAVASWQTLSEKEQQKSELYAELVKLQDEIITTLLAGKSANSPEITSILQQVNEVREGLMLANIQADKIRAELIPL